MNYECARCGVQGQLPSNPDVVRTVRCARCGAVSHSDGEIISPRMVGFDYPDTVMPMKFSPWVATPARPVEPGVYECEFRDMRAALALYWDGELFRPRIARRGDYSRVPVVRTATLMKWRGCWL